MTPLASLWLPILAAAIGVFIASSIIHMATPWHHNDFAAVPDQARVMDVLRSFDIRPGDYVLPRPGSPQQMSSPEFTELAKRGPMVMMTVLPGEVVIAKNLALGLWQQTIWYNRSWVTTVKSTIDGLVYGLVTAGAFVWLWPR